MLKSQVLQAVKAAKSAVQDLAVDALLVRGVARAFVPGQPAAYDETTSPLKLIVTRFDNKEIDGERIMASDLKAIVFGEVQTYANDYVTMASKSYRFVASRPSMVGSEVAASELQLRIT